MKFGIGQSPTRIEDTRLLSGQGSYTDDLTVTGAAHGYVLRSPVAHATITSIETVAAKSAPGVLAVLTGADLETDGVGDIQSMTAVKNHDGSDIHKTPWPILAKDRVRFVGNPVAFVVAETLEQAKDAAELVEIEYDALPVEVDTYAAAQPGASQIWDHIPENVAFDYAKGDKDAVDAIFA
ncbi:MAG: xanthine dehydrogenase family protein molybdopterin-binding subunit, partial [Pseudomonadota bacterium]